MAGHGHDNCPHCEHQLEGLEAVCPACQGDLFGVPSKIVQVKEKVTEIVQKVESEVREAVSVEGDLVGSVQRASKKIGGHVVPVFSTVKQAGTDAVGKVRDKIGGEAPQQSNQQDFDEDEEDLESLITQGELLVSEGKENQAMKIFNRVIASDPSNAMAWFNRGVIHEMSGQADEAAKAFKVCLDMQADHGPAAANLAVLLDRTGSSAEAATFAHRALKSFPSHPDLARISNQGPAEETPAIQTAAVSTITEEVITAPPVEPEPAPVVVEQVEPTPELDLDAIVEDAANLIRQNQPEQGLELLRDLLHNEASQHPRAWRVAAASMARLSLIDNAIEAFTYALDLDNTDAASWYNLGALHRRNGHEETAVTCFDAALGLRPDYTKASAALAEIHTANGSLTLAIESWRSLLSHEPEHPGGPTFAGILIAIAEGEGEVLEMAKEIPTTIPEGPELAAEALKFIPDNGSSENVQLRARAMTLSGSYPEAVKAWRSLIETDRDNPDLWTGMRKTFIAAGDQATAEKCRAKIASLTGENIETVEVSEPASTSVLEPVQEPEPMPEPEPEPVVEAPIEETPQPETATEPEEVATDDPWADDPWGDMDSQTDSSESTELVDDAGEEASEEIVAAEEILDSTPEPEAIIQTEASPEVDLAKAALDVATNTPAPEILGSGKIDSSSISNQDAQWYNKGLTLLTEEKYNEALACFDRALPTFVNDDEMVVRILNARGNAFYYLKEFSDCIDAYHQAMKVNPAGVTGATLYNMGTAYAEVERYADAIKCFEQGMSEKRISPLAGEHAKMAKEQIRRCKLLLKEQEKKMKRLSRMKN